MNSRELARKMAAAAGIKEHQAMRALATIPREIKATLRLGGTVKLGELGTFKYHKQAARSYKHWKTGETIDVPQKFTMKFHPSRGNKEL